MKSKNKNNFLGKIIILIWLALLVLSACGLLVEASTTTYRPTLEEEYFELRATTINKDVNGQRQLIMELWGHNIDFEGFEVRFEYDKTKLQPSIISTSDSSKTNIGVDPSDVNKYFKFVGEFAGTGGQSPVLEFEEDISEKNADNVIVAEMSFNLNDYDSYDDIPTSDHVIERDESKVVTTITEDGKGVKLGEMSFRMLTDEAFVLTNNPEDTQNFYFGLVENFDRFSPKTGIKVQLNDEKDYDLNGEKDYHQFHLEDKSTFIFTDMTASKDANLEDLVVSSGEVNQENPDESTYKEYDLNPKFQENKEAEVYTLTLMEYIDTINIKATQSDENAKMKIKVPKHDSDGNLVYDSDGTTIIYEEKDMTNKVPFGVELNKLGDPDTEVTITVTAEDEVTTETYKIIIKRPYATIKGEVYLPPMSSKGIHIADIRLYKSSDVSELFVNNSLGDWDTIQSKVDLAGDNVHNLLLTLNSENYKTNSDGTYEIYVIPGTYDLLIDKASYLDYVYINQTVLEGDVLELDACTLLAGDVDKNGLIDIDDYAIVGNAYKAQDGDSNYVMEYDFDESLEINIDEIAYIGNNYLKVREIIK